MTILISIINTLTSSPSPAEIDTTCHSSHVSGTAVWLLITTSDSSDGSTTSSKNKMIPRVCVLCSRNRGYLGKKKNLKIAYIKIKSELSFYQREDRKWQEENGNSLKKVISVQFQSRVLRIERGSWCWLSGIYKFTIHWKKIYFLKQSSPLFEMRVNGKRNSSAHNRWKMSSLLS